MTHINIYSWYDLDLIVVYSPEKNFRVETYSQMVPVPKSITSVIKEDTPTDYEFIDTGYGVTASQIMSANLQVSRILYESRMRFVDVDNFYFIFVFARCIRQNGKKHLRDYRDVNGYCQPLKSSPIYIKMHHFNLMP